MGCGEVLFCEGVDFGFGDSGEIGVDVVVLVEVLRLFLCVVEDREELVLVVVIGFVEVGEDGFFGVFEFVVVDVIGGEIGGNFEGGVGDDFCFCGIDGDEGGYEVVVVVGVVWVVVGLWVVGVVEFFVDFYVEVVVEDFVEDVEVVDGVDVVVVGGGLI